MRTPNKLWGGVITSFEKRSHGVIELLAIRLRDRIALEYYGHPHEIGTEQPHFLIVFTPDDLTQVVASYRAKHKAPPLIIHIDTPQVLQTMDYAAQFPDVEVAPIEQANLSSKDITLKIDLFEHIIQHLERLA